MAGGSRNFICTKDYIEKTFGPEQATNMNTYKFMKVGGKKCKESGSSAFIENPKAKKRIGGSRNFICTKDYIKKTFGPEQATNINTYKFMKVGGKKYKESGSSASVENPKAKKHIVNLSSPSTENGGTPLTASSHVGDQSDIPPPSQHHTTRAREDSPILDA